MPRKLIVGLILAILLAVGAGITAPPEDTATAAPAQQGSTELVAGDMLVGDPNAVNLNSVLNAFRGAYSSPGDGFQKYQRGVSSLIPFALVDDSVSIFTSDDQGIVGESDTEEFFGIVDTVNGDPVNDTANATWTFDISGVGSLDSISIDLAAMGDFETSDEYLWEARIVNADNNSFPPFTSLFSVVVDKTATQTYVLDSGNTFTLPDPMTVNSTLLTNDFQSFTFPLAGSGGLGTTLELRVTATANGGDEALAFRNIRIFGEVSTLPPDVLDVRINEMQISTAGTDFEFIELVGTPGTDLSSLTIVGIDGDAGSSLGEVDNFFTFTGATIPADGYFVATNSLANSTYGITGDTTLPNNQFENSSATYLLVGNFTGADGQDLDTTPGDGDGTLDTTPWEVIVDSVAFNDGGSGDLFYEGAEVVGPDGGFLPSGAFRCPNETGTFSGNILNFSTPDGTPGMANPCTPVVVINEIMQNPDAVNDGDGEWLELYNPGASPVDIDGWTIEDAGSNSHVINNGGPLQIPAGGYLVLGNNGDSATNGGVNVAYQYSSFTLANSDDEVILLDGSGTEVDRVEYDGGPNFPDPTGASMQLDDPANDNNVGANWCEASNATYGDGDFGTPNAANDCSVAPPSVVRIHEVQGSGSAVPAPIDGTIVTVQAIVVGDYQENDQLDGFFIQEESGDEDGNLDTSEGIFVFCGSNCTTSFPDVAEGDLVTVTGEAGEFFDMSQIDATITGGSITLDGDASNNDSGTGLDEVTPAMAMLPVPNTFATVDAYFERFEGMLVEFNNTLVATEYFQLGRFGQVVLAAENRPFQYTQDPANVPFNVTDYNAFLDDLDRSTIILDDDNNIQNAPLGGFDGNNPAADTAIYHPQTGTPTGFDVNNFFRGGSTVSTPSLGGGNNLIGVLHWSWAGTGGTNAWRIRPLETNPVDFDNTPTPRPAAPAITGNVSVAAFNVLNYFNGDGAGGGFPTPRGADSQAEFVRQTDKIVAAINALDADVVGLIEIENEADNPPDGITSATEDLVIALNVDAGAATWDYVVTTTAVGTDEIKQAIIYKPAIVSPVGAVQIVDDPQFVEPRTPSSPKNRPAVVQTFEIVEAGNPDLGAEFTVIVNHLKSKGSGCGAGDDDTMTGQGNCNGTRTDAMDYLINTWLPNNGLGTDENVLIIGDINAYYAEDPMQVAYDAGYVNVLQPDEYTYVFDGQLGSLDHILVSPGMTGAVESAAPWNINADEVNVLDYNDDIEDSGERWFDRKTTVNDLYDPDAFRSSDHDPLVVGLDLPGTTLDGGDSRIKRSGNWTVFSNNPAATGGNYFCSANGRLNFVFTGTTLDIRYAPLNLTSQGTFVVLIDNGTTRSRTVDFDDPANLDADGFGIASFTNLPDTDHLLEIQAQATNGFVCIDIITAELVDEAPTSVAPTPISPTGTINTTNPTFEWTHTETSDVDYYFIFVNAPQGFQQWHDADAICSGNTCSVDLSLSLADGNYSWTVEPWNNAGLGTAMLNQSFDVQTLVAPGNFDVTPTATDEALLTWDATGTGADEFRVERSVNGGSFQFVDTVSQPTDSFTDTGLSCGTTYVYRIRSEAVGGGLSPFVEADSITQCAVEFATSEGDTLPATAGNCSRSGARFNLPMDNLITIGNSTYDLRYVFDDGQPTPTYYTAVELNLSFFLSEGAFTMVPLSFSNIPGIVASTAPTVSDPLFLTMEIENTSAPAATCQRIVVEYSCNTGAAKVNTLDDDCSGFPN